LNCLVIRVTEEDIEINVTGDKKSSWKLILCNNTSFVYTKLTQNRSSYTAAQLKQMVSARLKKFSTQHESLDASYTHLNFTIAREQNFYFFQPVQNAQYLSFYK
jgi:hypothetical protein